MDQVIEHWCNWNDVDILYSGLDTVLHREATSAITIYYFRPQKTQFISGLMGRRVIDNTQLG